MAEQDAITQLEILQDYYSKTLNEAQARIYVSTLAPVDPRALRYAIQEWISKSQWMPKVNELLEVAATWKPAVWEQVTGLDVLWQEAQDKYYQTGELDAEEWRQIADGYQQQGRPARAMSVLSRLEAFTCDTLPAPVATN